MSSTDTTEPVEQQPSDGPRVDPRLKYLERRLIEAFDELWDDFVDPAEAIYDVDGTPWNRLGGGPCRAAAGRHAVRRRAGTGRKSATSAARWPSANEFAINGHENRISYIVGSGHAYRAVASTRPARRRAAGPRGAGRAGRVHPPEPLAPAAAGDRPPQGPRRRVFLAAVCRPPTARRGCGSSSRPRWPRRRERHADPSASFGIQTDPDDVETVLGYWIDGRLVDAAEIQHRKANVDANVKRGLPLFYPVRKNLRRAEKLLRNMSVVAEIQSAIAVIRKHTRRHGRRPGAVRGRPGRPERHQRRPPAGPAISAATPPARSSTPWPAPTTSSPPPASTPAAT